jgi:hypothetical protein
MVTEVYSQTREQISEIYAISSQTFEAMFKLSFIYWSGV